LDIGVLGYIGIVWPKGHSPEVWSVPPVTPCIFKVNKMVKVGWCLIGDVFINCCIFIIVRLLE